MLPPFPTAGLIEIPPSLARDLLTAAESLPVFQNKEFYDLDVQGSVYDGVRNAFPEAFDWLTGLLKERLAQRPYCVLVKGLSFDSGNRLFVAINRAFGELVAPPYQKPRAQLVHYVQPSTDILSTRGGHESERLHTDTADWDEPVEFISMVCIRPDHAGGGRSRILDVDSVREEVTYGLGSDGLRRLETEAVPWRLAPYFGGGVKWRPILAEAKMCWRRYTIEQATTVDGTEMPHGMPALLDAFEDVISRSERTIDFLMREGELLFSNNRRTIHARTPIEEGVASNRLMIRSWIKTS